MLSSVIIMPTIFDLVHDRAHAEEITTMIDVPRCYRAHAALECMLVQGQQRVAASVIAGGVEIELIVATEL